VKAGIYTDKPVSWDNPASFNDAKIIRHIFSNYPDFCPDCGLKLYWKPISETLSYLYCPNCSMKDWGYKDITTA